VYTDSIRSEHWNTLNCSSFLTNINRTYILPNAHANVTGCHCSGISRWEFARSSEVARGGWGEGEGGGGRSGVRSKEDNSPSWVGGMTRIKCRTSAQPLHRHAVSSRSFVTLCQPDLIERYERLKRESCRTDQIGRFAARERTKRKYGFSGFRHTATRLSMDRGLDVRINVRFYSFCARPGRYACIYIYIWRLWFMHMYVYMKEYPSIVTGEINITKGEYYEALKCNG